MSDPASRRACCSSSCSCAGDPGSASQALAIDQHTLALHALEHRHQRLLDLLVQALPASEYVSIFGHSARAGTT